MIEVGYLEHLSLLRIDVEWWLVNSGGLTRMTIIVLVSGSPDRQDIKEWELSPNPRPKTRHTPTIIPIATRKIQIDNAANVGPANASLTFPYGVILDNPHLSTSSQHPTQIGVWPASLLQSMLA